MNSRTIYLNGEFIPLDKAMIPVLDRGFIFGDGIYEVIPVYKGVPFRIDEHLQRLANSLSAIKIDNPHTNEEWLGLLSELISKQEEANLSIYLQITRGIAPRDHVFPNDVTPTIFIMTNPMKQTDIKIFEEGIAAIVLEDTRWKNCHIKSIALLPNILLKQQAQEASAYEAILIRDGFVTEGAASNVFIVKDETIITPPKSNKVLPGITRDLILELALKNDIKCKEAEISEAELLDADEIWISSSTREILPVVKLDRKAIGNEKPGAVTRKIFDIYKQYKNSLCN